MKKTIILSAFVLIGFAAAAQQQPSRPVHLDGKEVDSTKARIIMLSQRIADISELSQGKAKELQQMLADMFNTITRKEEKQPVDKPKQK